VRARLDGRIHVLRRIRRGWEATAGFPLFVYGATVNALPYFVPRWVSRRLARKETDYATTRFLASVVAFPLFWGLETWAVARLMGPGWALIFFASLPATGLVAYHYVADLGRLGSQLRLGALAATRSRAASRLLAERRALVSELDRARDEYLAATRTAP